MTPVSFYIGDAEGSESGKMLGEGEYWGIYDDYEPLGADLQGEVIVSKSDSVSRELLLNLDSDTDNDKFSGSGQSDDVHTRL